jgi:arabinofuranan 3-O-arabinosyltransferase
VTVPDAVTPRVLVVPESINGGWVARASDGTRLVPVAVNGWQQGWVVPAGTGGTITCVFEPNRMYRLGMAGGLALLPLLALLAWWPARRTRDPGPPAQPWRLGGRAAVIGALTAGALIAGGAGVVVFGAALLVLFALRNRRRAGDAARLGLSAGGLILAGAVLCRHPWRSVDGYAGHSAGAQLLALVSVAAVAATAVLARSTNPR